MEGSSGFWRAFHCYSGLKLFALGGSWEFFVESLRKNSLETVIEVVSIFKYLG